VFQPGGLCRSISHVDEDGIGGKFAHFPVIQKYIERLWRGEASLSHQQIQPLGTFDTPLAAAAKALDDIAFALAHNAHIDRNRPCLHAIVCPALCKIGHAPAGNHRFRGRAALIDARSSHMYPLDQRRFAPGACQRR